MPRVALAVLAQALAKNVLQPDGRYGAEFSSGGYSGDACAQITVHHKAADMLRNADDLKDSPAWTALVDQGRQWLRRFNARPKGQAVLAWLLSLDEADLHAFIALAVAFSLDAIEAREYKGHLPSSADRIAQAVGLDMARWWEPTPAAYLAHVSKAMVAAAVGEAHSPARAKAVEKMKKGDAVAEAAKVLAGTGWLPAPLRARPVTDDELPGEESDAQDDDDQGEAETDGAPEGERAGEAAQAAADLDQRSDGDGAANDGAHPSPSNADAAAGEDVPDAGEAFAEEGVPLAA